MMAGGVKGIGALTIFGVSYLNHIFSPLIWGLLVLVVIDILLNAHKQGEQLNKIGTAFITLGGTSLISSFHTFNLETVHALVAIMVIAYIQIVSPQIVAIINKTKSISGPTKAELIAALEAENKSLKQMAITEENKVIVTTGAEK